MQLSELLLLQVALFLFPMNARAVLNKITLLVMQYVTSLLLCNRSFEVYTGVS